MIEGTEFRTTTNQQGMTLIGVLAAMGLVAILAVTMATLFTYMNRSQKGVDLKAEAAELNRLVSQLLADPEVCTCIFTQASTAPGMVTNPPYSFDPTVAPPVLQDATGGAEVPLSISFWTPPNCAAEGNEVIGTNGKVLVPPSAGIPIATSGDLQVSSISVPSLTQINGSSWQSNVNIQLMRAPNSQGISSPIFSYNTSVIFTTAASATPPLLDITGCIGTPEDGPETQVMLFGVGTPVVIVRGVSGGFNPAPAPDNISLELTDGISRTTAIGGADTQFNSIIYSDNLGNAIIDNTWYYLYFVPRIAGTTSVDAFGTPPDQNSLTLTATLTPPFALAGVFSGATIIPAGTPYRYLGAFRRLPGPLIPGMNQIGNRFLYNGAGEALDAVNYARFRATLPAPHNAVPLTTDVTRPAAVIPPATAPAAGVAVDLTNLVPATASAVLVSVHATASGASPAGQFTMLLGSDAGGTAADIQEALNFYHAGGGTPTTYRSPTITIPLRYGQTGPPVMNIRYSSNSSGGAWVDQRIQVLGYIDQAAMSN